MEETSEIQSSIASLREKYTPEQLKTELCARRNQTEALLRRPVGLSHIPADLLSEALAQAPQMIYGPDDRVDLYQLKDKKILQLAASTVLIIKAEDLVKQKDGTYTLKTVPLNKRLNIKICKGQPFVDQPTAGFCTGFFITPSCIATAGHCVKGKEITDLRFVIGVQMLDAKTPVTKFRSNQIFQGVQLIRTRMWENLSGEKPDEADYAIVQVKSLDGKTLGNPLPISSLSVFPEDSVFVIGHPSYLPTKFAPNSIVRDNSRKCFFIANLDVLGGNSGSPVFDLTNTVVGIYVSGDDDWEITPEGCWIVATTPHPNSLGEAVQRISGVVGPVRDLSLQLIIGSNGLWTDRGVYIRLNETFDFIQLPQSRFWPWQSYTFDLDPHKMGIETIDDIDYFEIQSPSLKDPLFWDNWVLSEAILRVNGGQDLHKLTVNHTFYDQDGSSTHWESKLTVLPDKYILGTTLLRYGSTPAGSTNWQRYNNDPSGLFVDIDTSSANFGSTPLYFTSLGGDSYFWLSKGVNAIYAPSANGFRIYLKCQQPTSPEQANEWNWHINWFGYLQLIKGKSTMNIYGDSTEAGNTDWLQYGPDGLCVTIDTSEANFSSTPLYYTSLGGNAGNWMALGATSIYQPTPTSLKIYLRLSPSITPEQANEWEWHVNWVGIESSL